MKGIIFDFNGTLFLDNDKHILAWGAISQELRGRPITPQELHTQCNGKNNVLIVDYMTQGKADEKQKEFYSQKKEALYRDFCKNDPKSFHLIAGAEELFDTLKKQGIPFTIASASIKENIDFFVESFHLDSWIDPKTIVYDDGSFYDKVAMFQEAARRLGVDIEDVCVVEDSLAGISNAWQAGVRDIRVINSSGNRETLASMPGVVSVSEDLKDFKLDGSGLS